MNGRNLILLSGLLLASLFFSGQVQAVESQKRDLQWAYIMNFMRYVSWPNATVDPLIKVCIVGKNPFDKVEGEVKLSEKTGAIAVTTSYDKLPDIETLQRCDLIYFAQNITLAQLSFVFSKLKGEPILTIGDHKGFNKVGGLLQFIERDNRLAFRLNKDLLSSTGLKIHPSLLRLSD